jgi:CheY-like chemotaxis protein/anti-sigma regulatory factor (Ser/Thr protein kinase)
VHAVLRECFEAVAPRADLKGVALRLALDANRFVSDGDPLRLRQVFNNLLSNAVKFTGRGGEIWLRSWDREHRLLVEVQDNGVGFEPSETERLFQSFEQLHRTQSAGGLGLGLALSKGLVELHGGSITASSRGPGLGARFLVELPLLAFPAESLATQEPKTAPTASSDVVPRRRILLVEDDEDTAEMMGELLNDRGFQVVLANSIERALTVDLNEVDAIVSDIGLPDGSGTELLARLDRTQDLPAIALSGYGMVSDIEASRAAGFDLHLTKPVDFETLVQALHGLLARRGGPDALAND